MALEAGQQLLHYRLIDKIGEGGMGVVWKAEDTKLRRNVALKVLPEALASDPERRARFEREARTVASLNHPNIVTLHSVEECEGLAFITMELVDGKPLSELIPGDGLPLARFLEIAIPLADAIAAAHRSGITHRDLKPANGMVTGDGRVKVLDFGLAKLTDVAPVGPVSELVTTTAGPTTEGQILGTVAYMSPEQAEGKPVDTRSDVFSLGVVLYEMATGRRPFGGDSAVSTIASILRDVPAEIGELKPELPRDLDRIVRRCLAKSQDKRFQSALEIRNELQALAAEVASGGMERPAPQAVSPPTSRRKTSLVIGLAVAAVAIVVAGALLWPRPSGSPGATSASSSVRSQSIAVLPFANMSGDPDNEYFSDGLAEELLNVLARLKGLHVAARTSSFHFKGYTGDISEIGRQLNVATILEGSVRRAGDKVRVTAQLINAADGFHLWSETYDRKLDDIFAIQEDIAEQVVGALKVTLLGEEAERLARRPTENLAAYDAYLLGQQRRAQGRSDSLIEAAAYFQKAIDLDPAYALAYVGLADVRQFQVDHGTIDGKEALSQAESLIATALKLDDRLGEAYASLGSIRQYGYFDHDGADKAYRRAIELNPGYATAYEWYGLFEETRDRAHALKLLEKALELDPLSATVNSSVAGCLAELGRIDEALARYRRVIEIDPRFTGAYFGIARIYAERLDRPEEAEEWYEKAIELDPGDQGLRFALASVYQAQGRIDDALGLWQRMIDADPELAQSPFVVVGRASIYQYAGRFEEAEAVWRAVGEADPDSELPYTGLGYLYLETGKLDQAVRSFKQSQHPYSHLSLARAYLLLDDEPRARQWQARFSAEAPGNPQVWLIPWALHIRHAQIAESEALLREHQELPDCPQELIWFYDMRAGLYQAARERYEVRFPRLAEDDPPIKPDTLLPAINVAAALLKSGDRARAEKLLRNSETWLEGQPEGVRRASFRLQPLFIHALQGRTEDAIAAFRSAVEHGWRDDWRWLKLDPKLASVVGDPRFEALIGEVRDDLAAQRKRLAADGLATP